MTSSKNNNDIKIREENDLKDINLDDFEIKDVSFDVDIKPKNEKSTTVVDVDNKNDKFQDAPETQTLESNISNDISLNDNEDSTDTLHDIDDYSSNADIEEYDHDQNSISTSNNDSNENLTENDDRSIEEKVQDLKDDIKQTEEDLKNAKNKIENLPEDIKNKKEDLHKKAEKTKENIKDLPEKTKKKVNEIKDKANQIKEDIQNFPKDKEELASAFKERLAKSAEKAKEKIRDVANKTAEKEKDNLRNKVKNSKPVKAAKKVKKTAKKIKKAVKNAKKAVKNAKKAVKIAKRVAKAAVKAAKALAKAIQGLVKLIVATFPVSVIVICVILVIFLLVFIFTSIFPGTYDVNDSEQYENYSESDIKILEKMKNLYRKYPNADAALSMVTVLYPYYESLHSDEVLNFEASANENWDPDKTIEDYKDLLNYEDSKESEDEESCEGDNCDSEIGDDIYLKLFKKWSFRRKFKLLLKKSNSMTEDEFFNYLKNEYFKSESGYVYLLSNVEISKQDEFENAIIEDLKVKRELFINYIFKNVTCSSTLIDAGSVSTPTLISTGVVIDLKKPGCSNMSQCSDSYYNSYLSLEEYVKGVVYEEISGTTDLGIIEAQMIAVKSFALSRRKVKKDDTLGVYVVPMLWSTADQDFCHVEKGCNAPDIPEYYGYNNNGNKKLMHGRNRTAANETQKALYNKAWEETKNIYMLDSKGNVAATGYSVGASCKIGNCMRQDTMATMTGKNYNEILSSFYTLYSIATVSGNDATIKTISNTICSNNTTNLTSTRNKVVSFASAYVGKIPYVEGSVASKPNYEGNGFDIANDVSGNEIKIGLGNIGFINWVYWSTINNNFGNTNDFQNIINNSYEITRENLLLGDIGYSSDKTVFAIYVGENKWVYEDSITGNIVIEPSDKFTKFLRINDFKEEVYNFTIRNKNPKDDWRGDNMLWVRDEKNVGQCVWYVRNRAIEIINELCDNGSLTEKKCKVYKNRVATQRGDGKDFYPNGPASKGFNGSLNIDDIKAGSFIGLYSTTSVHGHVGLIEYVSKDKQKIIYTDGYARGDCSKNNLSCVKFSYKEFNSFDEFKNYFTRGSHYTYRGYLYFLED